MLSTGVWIRAGISSNKVLAKMATDNFAKKSESGIFELPVNQVESILWPLPVSQMYMVGSRMTVHFVRMGLNTIGDIARLELGEFKRHMRIRMGRQSDIKAEYYWQTARGIDPSPVVARAFAKPKSITRGRTVQSTKYQTMEDIEPLMIELVIEVCRTSRRYNSMARVVTVSAGTNDERIFEADDSSLADLFRASCCFSSARIVPETLERRFHYTFSCRPLSIDR